MRKLTPEELEEMRNEPCRVAAEAESKKKADRNEIIMGITMLIYLVVTPMAIL